MYDGRMSTTLVARRVVRNRWTFKASQMYVFRVVGEPDKIIVGEFEGF